MIPCASVLVLVLHTQWHIEGFQIVLLGAMFFCLAQFPLVLLHECGHAAAGWLLRGRPYAIVIGEEPWRVDRDVLGVRWRIGDIWTGGITFHDGCAGSASRMRTLLITAAGPAVNLLVAMVALGAFGAAWPQVEGPVGRLARLAVGLASAFQFIHNVWPHELQSSAGRIANDGTRMLGLLRRRADDADMAGGARRYHAAMLAFGDGDFRGALALAQDAEARGYDARFRLALVQLKSAALIELNELDAAERMLRPLLLETVEDWGARAVIANNRACIGLLRDVAAERAEALEFSARAYAIAPWENSIAGTRACLLAVAVVAADGAGGTDAIRALLAARAESSLTRRQRAWTALALGLCAVADRDVATARQLLRDARALGAPRPALQLLERRIPSH